MKVILNEEQLRTIIKEMTSDEIDVRANEAATNPTDPQKEAGNYKMGHISVKGMKISIENPKGSRRTFKKDDGSTGYVEMQNHYGYFNVTKGKDGDAVDVFIGPNIENFENVFCVDQNNKEGEFDETKVMLGFDSKDEAKQAYLSNYSPGWTGFRDITAVSLKLFKKWLYRGRKQRQPFGDYVEIQKKQLAEERRIANREKYEEFMSFVADVERHIMALEGMGGLCDYRAPVSGPKHNYTHEGLAIFYGGKNGPQNSFINKAIDRALANLKEKGIKLNYYDIRRV